MKLLDVVCVLSLLWCDDMELDFAAMCKLGFASRCLQVEFDKIRRVHFTLPRRIRSWTRYWTLPSQIQSVIVCIRHMQHFDDVAMRWWLDVILSNCAVACCNVECGRVTKLQWIQLCNFMYELVQEQGELRVPLHFFVEGFRLHRQAPCRSPHELPWVADSSHLLFHMSSQITVSTPTVLISSQWVLDQLGVARE